MFSSPWALEEELRRLSVSDEMLLYLSEYADFKREAEINQIDYFFGMKIQKKSQSDVESSRLYRTKKFQKIVIKIVGFTVFWKH